MHERALHFHRVVHPLEKPRFIAGGTAGGGTILNGPMEVPGGAWIIQASDPQGAMFALVGSKDAA